MHRFQRAICTAVFVFWSTQCISGCVLLIAGAAGGAAAGTAVSVKEGRETQHHSALAYTGTVLGNVLYVPAKAVFAGGGALTSGFSYVVTLGRPEPMRSIWNTSTGGNYVMTPSMVEGREPIHFAGTASSTRASAGQGEGRSRQRKASA